jgi:Enoyl-(Acyl carrier protein) reductase
MNKPDTPENRAPLIATIPLGRLADPKDIANMAAFLGSEDASFITGTIYEASLHMCCGSLACEYLSSRVISGRRRKKRRKSEIT